MAFKPDLCEDIEREDGQKAMRVGGRFQHADLKNANGRIYPFAILEREIGKAQDKIKNRNMLGELDHPADGQTSLHRVSHVITKLEMSGKEVYGEYETLSNDKGQNLRALLKDKVGIGISSRGSGHVVNKGDFHEVAEDFNLLTFDVVHDPSTPGATPKLLSEQVINLVNITEEVSDEDLLHNFYQVMNLKGFTGLKFQPTNVDSYINSYKDFIKQDLTSKQYGTLRKALLADDQNSASQDVTAQIMSHWNNALMKIKIQGRG